MVQCSKCGFGVSEAMKHALMSNMCPACGRGLFDDADMHLIQQFQNEISRQRFAFNLTEEILYDLSLFMFNTFKGQIGQAMVAAALQAKEVVQQPVIQTDTENGDVEISKESIRREVVDELREQIEEVTQEREDILSKAERLRRLHQQRSVDGFQDLQNRGGKISATKKTGPRVSRLG